MNLLGMPEIEYCLFHLGSSKLENSSRNFIEDFFGRQLEKSSEAKSRTDELHTNSSTLKAIFWV
jgi:hypothetical protein